MNCDLFKDKISAFIDEELGMEERLQMESHCEHCASCRRLIDQYHAMGELMRQSEARVDTDSLWEQVAHRLNGDAVASIATKSQPSAWAYAILTTAASIALIAFAFRNPLQNHATSDHDEHIASHEHASLSVDFEDVMLSAKSESKAAVAKLVAKYQGKELDPKATAVYLGYEPAIFKGIPDGFTRVSTHVLNMPCCKCSASICERSDGTSLILFEHKDEQPVWFGDSPSIETQCSGKSCKIIESAGQLAVSWKNEDRQLTMIGANDLAEVNQWVASMNINGN